jgi:hypothetical protein
MMASGRDLYNCCCLFEGQPYSILPGRTDPNSGHKDCSGLVAAGFQVCTGYELGAYVSTTIFNQSVRAGLEIPLWVAENIVGTLIFKPEDPERGWGSDGHIAVSDGYGGTIEATPPRVQRLPLSYNAPWSNRAVYAIDLDYSNYGEGSSSAPPSVTKEEDVMYIAVGDAVMGRVAAVMDGGYRLGELFAGPVNVEYGIPESAINWNNKPGRGFNYHYYDGDNELFAQMIQGRPPGT